MKSNNRLIYHLIAFLVVAIWGSTFVFTKLLLLGGLTPAQILTLRFIIAYLLLLGYSFISPPKFLDKPSGIAERGGARGGLRSSSARLLPEGRKNKHSFRLFSDNWRDELLMVALGVTGGSLYFLAENSSMNYTITTNTSLIVSLSPLVATFLISIFYQSQRLNCIQSIGTLMAALGVVIVVLNGHFVLHLSPLGDSLAFCAALCWGFYSLLMIRANQRYDTLFITRKVFFYGLLSMIPYFIVYPGLNISVVLHQPSLLWNLLFLACVASMLCYIAWNWVLKKLGAVVATNWVYFNPVTTIIFAWAILSEQITVYFITGTILILFGMYLADKKKQ